MRTQCVPGSFSGSPSKGLGTRLINVLLHTFIKQCHEMVVVLIRILTVGERWYPIFTTTCMCDDLRKGTCTLDIAKGVSPSQTQTTTNYTLEPSAGFDEKSSSNKGLSLWPTITK
jgi:hypothetical protein